MKLIGCWNRGSISKFILFFFFFFFFFFFWGDIPVSNRENFLLRFLRLRRVTMPSSIRKSTRFFWGGPLPFARTPAILWPFGIRSVPSLTAGRESPSFPTPR